MKVLVLGAGVVGITSAYYLAQAGHEVEVVDRQDGAGLETSFANAGQVSPKLKPQIWLKETYHQPAKKISDRPLSRKRGVVGGMILVTPLITNIQGHQRQKLAR